MDTVIGKYTLRTESDPAMAVCRFIWQEEEDNNVVLQWDWPAEPKVKLMLVFALDGTLTAGHPDIAQLLQKNHAHTVVSRNLSARYQAKLTEGRQRFLICPAYFNDQKNVVVYQPVYITDWIYKRTRIFTRVYYQKIWLGSYKRAFLSIDAGSAGAPFTDEVLTKALLYGIYEYSRLLNRYPAAMDLTSSHVLYIKKNQNIRFMVEERYSHLILLHEKQEQGRTCFSAKRGKGFM